MGHYTNFIVLLIVVFVIYGIFRFIKNLFFTKIVILILLVLAFFAGKYVFGVIQKIRTTFYYQKTNVKMHQEQFPMHFYCIIFIIYYKSLLPLLLYLHRQNYPLPLSKFQTVLFLSSCCSVLCFPHRFHRISEHKQFL